MTTDPRVLPLSYAASQCIPCIHVFHPVISALKIQLLATGAAEGSGFPVAGMMRKAFKGFTGGKKEVRIPFPKQLGL